MDRDQIGVILGKVPQVLQRNDWESRKKNCAPLGDGNHNYLNNAAGATGNTDLTHSVLWFYVQEEGGGPSTLPPDE